MLRRTQLKSERGKAEKTEEERDEIDAYCGWLGVIPSLTEIDW